MSLTSISILPASNRSYTFLNVNECIYIYVQAVRGVYPEDIVAYTPFSPIEGQVMVLPIFMCKPHSSNPFISICSSTAAQTPKGVRRIHYSHKTISNIVKVCLLGIYIYVLYRQDRSYHLLFCGYIIVFS